MEQIPFVKPFKSLDKYKVKIIAYRADQSACWNNRLQFPLYHLAKNHPDYYVDITGLLNFQEHSKRFDAIICQRQYKSDVYWPIKKMKEEGAKIIYEIDDDIINPLPDWNPASAILNKKAVKENVKAFLGICDACFVTTEELGEVYRPYCENIFVLPNCVDFNVFTPAPKNSKKKVVLWTGSQTHEKDVGLVKPAFEQLAEDGDALMKLQHIDLGIKSDNMHLVPFVDIKDFYSMLAEMDAYIGLAPITAHPFNKGKSNLKYLEYTAQGMVTIASDFGPYQKSIVHNKTGILISDNRDWYVWIRELLNNEELYNELLKNAQADVRENFDISKKYIMWKNAIDKVLGITNS